MDVSCFSDTRVVEKEQQEGDQMSRFEMGIEEDLELKWSEGVTHSNVVVGYNVKEFQPLAG